MKGYWYSQRGRWYRCSLWCSTGHETFDILNCVEINKSNKINKIFYRDWDMIEERI